MTDSVRADVAPSAKTRWDPTSSWPSWARVVSRVFLWLLGLSVSSLLAAATLVILALAVAYPNLPDIAGLSDYRPKLPLRVLSSDGVLLGEFGEERRQFTPIGQIPKVMKDAVLAIEDAHFYEHGGVDYKGVLRAGLASLSEFKSQGASTITMQLARNFYLSTEKTFTRKIYEILLALKIENQLSKEQILEVYMRCRRCDLQRRRGTPPGCPESSAAPAARACSAHWHGNAEAFFFKGSRAEPGIDAPSTEGAPEEQR